jgi:HemY protein
MRAALWFLGLFGIAVAVALFAGNNQGTVTLFWPPYRVDLSLNLVLLSLLGFMVVLHFALRALDGLLDIPRQARFWRAQQKERAMHAALLDALSHLVAGRFLRARKSAESALAQERSLSMTTEPPPHAAHLTALSHLLVAESAQALQDVASRDLHLKLALAIPGSATTATVSQETREGVQLRAARWALEDREPQNALNLLAELPQGVARRTIALRIKLKAARLTGQTEQALETARLLAKHGAFSRDAGRVMVRGLAIEFINSAYDGSQLERVWAALTPAEREMPELAVQAAQRLLSLQGDGAIARAWLFPVWEHMASDPVAFTERFGEIWRFKLVRSIEATLASLDSAWLARLETLQQKYPRLADLQYLVATACMQRQLWGKAQQLMTQATTGLKDPSLLRSAWKARAQLAEQQGDAKAALAAWIRAAGE